MQPKSVLESNNTDAEGSGYLSCLMKRLPKQRFCVHLPTLRFSLRENLLQFLSRIYCVLSNERRLNTISRPAEY